MKTAFIAKLLGDFAKIFLVAGFASEFFVKYGLIFKAIIVFLFLLLVVGSILFYPEKEQNV